MEWLFCSARDAPLLVVSSLAGGDDVDVTFLLRENLKLQEEKEEKERRREREEAEYEAHMQELDRRVQADVGRPRPHADEENEKEEEEGSFLVMHLEMCSLWSINGP